MFFCKSNWGRGLAEGCVLNFECWSLRTDLDAEHVFTNLKRTFSNLPLSLFSVRTPFFSLCGVPSPSLSTSYFLAFFSVLELQTGELRSVAYSFQFVLPTLLLDECNIWAASTFGFTVCDFSWGIDGLWGLEIRSVGSIIYDFSDVSAWVTLSLQGFKLQVFWQESIYNGLEVIWRSWCCHGQFLISFGFSI